MVSLKAADILGNEAERLLPDYLRLLVFSDKFCCYVAANPAFLI